ncbi:MAG: ABC transporter permease [Dehalococcoidia bacterium]|nr:ABC transporter permease [Dehalococcoidia bacterium]
MFANAVRDTRVMLWRELLPTLHEPWGMLFTMIQPLIFLGLFGPLLTGVPTVPGEASVWQWFVPGILVMLILFATSMTGFSLLMEMQTGSHERLMVTPMSRSAMIVGRSLKQIVPLAFQALLIVLVMIPFGFKLYPAGAVVGLAILCMLGIGLGALSFALALVSAGQDWIFWTVQQTLVFPLIVLSGVFLPIESGPGWMKVASQVNPITHIVDAERLLFAGELGDATILGGAAAALAFAAVGLWVGTSVIRKAAN